MFYYRVKEFENEFESAEIFSTEKRLEKESVVVIPNGYGEPCTAIIVEKVEEYVALSSNYEVEPIICVVDMKSYTERLNAKNKRALVLNKMQEMSSEIKLIESLKKLAEKDDTMRSLLKEYESTIQSDEKNIEEE